MSDLEDGRVEDGEALECLVCGVTTHMYAEDNHICPPCQAGGWEWTKAMYVRRGDLVSLGGEVVEVEAEESFDLRRAIYGVDGRCWMRTQIAPVLVVKQ